jgi:hypothetical protein
MTEVTFTDQDHALKKNQPLADHCQRHQKIPVHLSEHTATISREKTVSPNDTKKGVVKYSVLL